MNAYDEYMKEIVKPMRAELVNVGFKELTSAEMVNEHMENAQGTSLVVINSVCGCAAGQARPAVTAALAEVLKKPEHLVTVFAGQDQEATYQFRAFIDEVPASSPSIAILKDGKLAYFIPREQIEGFPMEQIKAHLVDVLNQVTA